MYVYKVKLELYLQVPCLIRREGKDGRKGFAAAMGPPRFTDGPLPHTYSCNPTTGANSLMRRNAII